MRRRGLVALGLVGVTALALWGYLGHHRRLRPLPESEVTKAEALLGIVNEKFGAVLSDCFLVAEAEDVLAPRAVAEMRRLVRAVEELEGVREVISLDRVPAFDAGFSPRPLLPDNDAGPEAWIEARRMYTLKPPAAPETQR